MDCLTWKINQAEMRFCIQFYWSEKWRETNSAKNLLPVLFYDFLRWSVSHFKYLLYHQHLDRRNPDALNIHIRNAIQTLRVIKSRVRAPDGGAPHSRKKGKRKVFVRTGRLRWWKTSAHVQDPECMLSVGHVTGEAGHVTRVKGLFIIRDISTIYRQSLDIFHEIVTFYNIYNYNKGKPYKQTVNRRFFSGSGDAEAFKFNFSLFLLFFFFFLLVVSGRSPLDPGVVRSGSARVSVSVSARQRL